VFNKQDRFQCPETVIPHLDIDLPLTHRAVSITLPLAEVNFFVPIGQDMRRQKSIMVILLLLLSAVTAFAAYPQAELPPEKKKALHRFDPVDIFPEARGREEDRAGKKSGQNAGLTALTRNAAPPPKPASKSGKGDQRSPGLSSGASDNAAGGTLKPSAMAPVAPNPTPIVTPTPLSQTAKPVPTQSVTRSVMLMIQSSLPPAAGSRAPATTVNQSVRAMGLSLPVILLLFGLVLFALVVVVIKLKKEIRAL